jgi:gliding motility-associated-like protein
VPNSFTPNGDGTNDLFQIFGNFRSLKFVEIQVFNRWGEVVFKSNDLNFAWDGSYKGSLQEPGMFVWQLNLTFIDGHDLSKKGSLTMIR